ncbi:MAG TPA: transketolase C-terminal domain-containing protein [Gaiellales bacterium]|jgi:transketolase|nr:transketolase C-terminal domain-containing protein [Gaiellales bacterium]
MTATMRSRSAATVVELMDADPRVSVVLAEISVERFEEALRRHPDRAVNVGIMEQTMIGVAAGMALEGQLPVAHSIAPFLVERSLEQIKLDLGNQELGAILIGTGGSYDYSTEGTTHHSPGDVQVLLSVPGIAVHVPGHSDEADVLLRHAHRTGGLTYLRTSAAENAAPRPIDPGRLLRVRTGRRGTVVAVGPMLDRTLQAVHEIDVTVLYATTVAPLDAAGLAAAAADAAEVISVEPFHEGTLAGPLAAALAGRPRRFLHIGAPRRVLRDYGSVDDLDRAAGLDAGSIRSRISEFLRG